MTEDDIDAQIDDLREALRYRRETQDLSQPDVEQNSGVSSSTVSYMETRAQFREIRHLILLADAYGIKFPDLAAAFRDPEKATSDPDFDDASLHDLKKLEF